MTLTASDFTDYRPDETRPSIPEQITDLRERLGDKRFSDTEDAAGQQYVDLVMEGGGVLGIALMGYVYVLEQCGLRFLSIAGTSAGAITALMLAGLGVPSQAKTETALPILAGMPMADFVDGNRRVKRLIDAFIAGSGPLSLGFKLLRVRSVLLNRLGLNPGSAFERWVDAALAGVGIETLEDLIRRMRTAPEGLRVCGRDVSPEQILNDHPLCLIAADISTETRARLPQMAPMYFRSWQSLSPAKLARMSMAVPYFFEPVTVRFDRDSADEQAWITEAGFPAKTIARCKAEGRHWLPKQSLFVDGGVLSNFPIDVFHDYSAAVPSRPTFGVKLELDVRAVEIRGIGKFTSQMFNAARHILDIESIRRNPEFAQLVSFIDTGDHNWLDFGLEDHAKLDLFQRGVKEGIAFLERFDWPAYAEARRQIGAGQRQMQATALQSQVADAVPRQHYTSS